MAVEGIEIEYSYLKTSSSKEARLSSAILCLSFLPFFLIMTYAPYIYTLPIVLQALST